MTKNVLLGIATVIIIALGAWFYFKTPVNAPNQTNTTDSTPTPNPTNGTDTTPNNNNQTNVNVDVNVDVGTTKSFTVVGSNFAFSPKEMRVKKGDKVRITFSSQNGMHDFKIDEFNVGTRILRGGEPAQTVEFTASKTGTFEYYCSVGTHRQMGMVGKLIVE